MHSGPSGHAGKFNLFAVFCLSLCLATPLIQGLGYHGPGFMGLALFAALAAALCAIFHKFTRPALSGAAFLAVLAALISRAITGLPAKICAVLQPSRSPDALFWPLLLIVAATLIFYILLFGTKRPLAPLMIIGLGFFVPLWYLFVDSAYPAALAYTACWFLLLSYKNGALYWGRAPREKEESEKLRLSWIRYTVVLLCTALLLALALPKNFAPLAWTALRSGAAEMFPFLIKLRGSGKGDPIRGGGEEFGHSSALSRETARLGEPLSCDPAVLLELRGRGGIYLKGSVFDSYRGQSWANTDRSAAKPSFTAPPAALSECLEEVEVRILHLRLKTRTVFSIQYPLEFTGLPLPLQSDRNGNLILHRSVPLGREYSVGGFIQACRSDVTTLEIEEEIPPDMDIFLKLPKSLPSRIQRLAREITAEKQGNHEKMKALESYLRMNCSYTGDATLPAGNKDFADSFLFGSGQGDCTHFATALAVMGRAAGVPTRYIIGFKAPKHPDKKGVYKVAGTDAHAWVEGYIPGAGWLPFEPTPRFNTADTLPLPEKREHGPSALRPGAEESLPGPGADPGTDPDVGSSIPFLWNSRIWPAQLLRRIGSALPAASLAALSILSLIIWRRCRDIKQTMRMLKQQEPRLRAVAYYNLALSLQERLGWGKYPGETPLEYSRRIARHVHTWNLDFAEISEGINLALYSKRGTAAPGLAGQTERFYRLIFNRYLSRAGRWRAFREILLQGKYFKSISRGFPSDNSGGNGAGGSQGKTSLPGW